MTKWLRSAPAAMPMPATETRSSGGLSFADPGAERPPVIGCGGDRPAADGVPGGGVEIRHAVAVDEGDRGFRLEEAHHVRAIAQERGEARVIGRAPELAREIAARLGLVLDDARARCEGVARDPEPAAGPGARPAEDRRLLDDEDVEPGVRRDHRGGEPAGSRSDDEHVADGRRSAHACGSPGIAPSALSAMPPSARITCPVT